MTTATATKKSAKATKAKSAKAKGAKKASAKTTPTGEKRLSALDAAALVLAKAPQPMSCPELIEAMAAQGLWTSPGGKTPAATLYSAILREITRMGAEARFKKTE